MEIIFTKGSDKDFIKTTRADGTMVETTFPKKGWYPHDAVHVIVESLFELENGFWGIVANGMEPKQVGEMAKEAGHASSKRAEIPQKHITELIIAERIVECYEAELWSEQETDTQTFKAVLEAACRASYVEFPTIKDSIILETGRLLKQSANKWQRLNTGQNMVMNYPLNKILPD